MFGTADQMSVVGQKKLPYFHSSHEPCFMVQLAALAGLNSMARCAIWIEFLLKQKPLNPEPKICTARAPRHVVVDNDHTSLTAAPSPCNSMYPPRKPHSPKKPCGLQQIATMTRKNK